MKKLLFVLPFFAQAAIAQVDSVTHVADTLSTEINYKLDSIEGSFNKQVDSLGRAYGHAKQNIETVKGRFQHKIDSLNNLSLPTEKYTSKVDSLNNELAQLQQNTTAKINTLKDGVSAKVESLKLPPQAKERISTLTASIDKVNLPSIDAGIGNKIGLGNSSGVIPNLSGGGINPAGGLPSVANLPSANTGLPGIPGTNNIQDNLGQLNTITGKAGDIQQQVQEGVTVDKVGETLESKASQLDQVKAIQGQNVPGQPGLPAEIPASGEQAKEQLVALAKTTAVNHFAGKEAVLMGAMDKMSKYKEKYNSVSSIKDLPDKRPNPMKEKPFMERLVPGLTLQFQSFRDFMLDVNGSVGYKFTSHITAGLGWNQRWAYTVGPRKFNADARIYGIRNYGEYHFKRGFTARAEVEYMNTALKPGITGSDVGNRVWVWSAFTGLKQEYRITRSLKGNAQVMYNLFDPHHKSPYINRINVRMGFEVVLRKKKAK